MREGLRGEGLGLAFLAMKRRKETVIETASFNPRVREYWLISVAWVLAVTIIGLPLALVWLAVGMRVTQRYLDRLECVLTNRSIRLKRGILVREEITVPLEKITDLKLVEGPIMRHLGLAKLAVETAGGGGGPQGSAAVSIVGLEDTRGFRERALEARDAEEEREESPPAPAPVPAPAPEPEPSALADPEETTTLDELADVLEEMRDLLAGIEQHLSKWDRERREQRR